MTGRSLLYLSAAFVLNKPKINQNAEVQSAKNMEVVKVVLFLKWISYFLESFRKYNYTLLDRHILLNVLLSRATTVLDFWYIFWAKIEFPAKYDCYHSYNQNVLLLFKYPRINISWFRGVHPACNGNRYDISRTNFAQNRLITV